jgi:murein L,D-transpeptidase YcbB/YkuD
MIDFKNNYTLPFLSKLILFIVFFSCFLVSCNDGKHTDITVEEIVETPEAINARAEDIIKGTLTEIVEGHTELPDSFRIRNAATLFALYERNSFVPLWSSNGAFDKSSDSLLAFIANSHSYGLFPEDYYYTRLASLKTRLIADTSASNNLDASLWAYSDMLMTTAFVQVVKDVKKGRLLPDSILARDTTLHPGFFQQELDSFMVAPRADFASKYEPSNRDYQKIKTALKFFLDSVTLKTYTHISTSDSLLLRKLVYQRIGEEDSIQLAVLDRPDSLQLSDAIRKYQKANKMKVDGKLTTALINRLNNTAMEKFIRIAINMDRYKQLPALPKQYLWVNLPGYYLQMRDSDTVVLRSKIVVGKPKTRTPQITSAISNMVTYPQWHIPESIIKGEILPGLKKDPGYTKRKGYSLIDKDGNEVDPYSVDWSKYKNGIPYRVIQGSGDDNALGVLKFNFPNTHSVYLHDTNQRYLFSRTSRALSHGCVRVQAWNDLARYILQNDSVHTANAVPVDSLQSWLTQKKKQYVPVRKPIPLYIRYFTLDANEEKLVFYEDIYGEDKKLRDKIFPNQ